MKITKLPVLELTVNDPEVAVKSAGVEFPWFIVQYSVAPSGTPVVFTVTVVLDPSGMVFEKPLNEAVAKYDVSKTGMLVLVASTVPDILPDLSSI